MKLILHIGGAKCGSSAIQQVIAENAARLRAAGILVPSARLSVEGKMLGQQIQFFLRVVGQPSGSVVVTRRLRALRREMSEHGLHTLVVSAENLINPNVYADLFARANDLFDVQIVAYVRRQDDYLISAWQQWALKVHPSLDAFLDARVGVDANWSQLLVPWERQFGRERIVVRRFQRASLKAGDVVEDFFGVTGLPLEEIERSHRLYNRSWNEHAGELAHRVRDMFEDQHDNRIFGDLRHAIGPAVYKDYSGSLLLTLEQRREILAAYEECNAAIRAKYFPNLPAEEPLFDPPDPDDVVELNEVDRLRGQQDLLVRALIGLTRRTRGLERTVARLEAAAEDAPGE